MEKQEENSYFYSTWWLSSSVNLNKFVECIVQKAPMRYVHEWSENKNVFIERLKESLLYPSLMWKNGKLASNIYI